jgi:hypothetical protein
VPTLSYPRPTAVPFARIGPVRLAARKAAISATEKESAMSTYWGLIKNIRGCDVFDGRLEAFSIREHIVPVMQPQPIATPR